MNRIASAIARAFGGAKGIFARKSKKDLEETESAPRSVESLDEGYTKHAVPGGTIYITEPSERAYFSAEEEYSPTIMTVTPATLAEANAGPRRTARFEDPADEFINASSRSERTEIDYSVFKVRAPPVSEKVEAAPEPESVEIPAESESEPVIIEVNVSEIPEVVEAASVEEVAVPEAVAEETEVPEAVFEVPAPEPVMEAEEVVAEAPVEAPLLIAAPVSEPETAAETEEAPLLIAAPEPAPEVIVEAPVASEEVFEVPVEEVIVPGTEEMTPAEEIKASTMIPGIAGVSAYAETSEAMNAPVYKMRGENDIFGAFYPQLTADADDLSNSEEFSVSAPDDGLEEFFTRYDREVEEQEAAEIAFAAMLAAEAAREPVAAPVLEEAAEPAVEAHVPVEVPVSHEITSEEEPMFKMLAGESAPVFEAPAEEEIVFHIPEVEEEPYVAPAPAVEEVPVEEEFVFHIPEVEEEPYVAPAPVEPVVEVSEVEEIPAPVFEAPTVEEAPAEVASETVAETPSGAPQKAAEPAIISRRAVNPADVAAILFG